MGHGAPRGTPCSLPEELVWMWILGGIYLLQLIHEVGDECKNRDFVEVKGDAAIVLPSVSSSSGFSALRRQLQGVVEKLRPRR